MGWPRETTASVAVFTAGVMWGVWWLPLRFLAEAGAAGLWPVLLIYAASALMLLPTAIARRRRLIEGGRGLLFIGLCIGGALSGWSYAIIAGEVVRVSMLYYLAPIWATLLSVLWLGEPITRLRLLSIPLGLGGAAVILGIDANLPLPRNLPEWLGLGAGMLFAIGATYQRARPEISVHDRTFVTYVSATLVGILAMTFVPSPAGPALLALPVLTAAVAAAGLMAVPSYFLLFWGSRYLDSGRVNLLLIVEGVISTATASIITDEPFGWREASGCVLIIGAIAVEGLAQLRELRGMRAAA